MAFGLRKKRDLEVRIFKMGVLDLVKTLKNRFRKVGELYLAWKDRKEMQVF